MNLWNCPFSVIKSEEFYAFVEALIRRLAQELKHQD
jgi:hypothetical protein